MPAIFVKSKLLGMSTPVRPEETIDEETKRILADRDKVFAQEEKKAQPWRDVKAKILRQQKPAVL